MKSKAYKLIILHGWRHDKSKWDGFIQYFEPNEVLVFDLPGFGEEKLIDSSWGIPEYSMWVKEKIEALGESNLILLGHSFGGRIAGYIASENPAWLKGLILYGSPLLYRPVATIRIKIKIAKLLKGLGFSKTNQDMMYPIFKRVVIFDETKLLPKITAPTLLLWGDNDTEAPIIIAKEAHALIPDSQLTIMQDVGHNAHLENQNLFYGIIKKFINDL